MVTTPQRLTRHHEVDHSSVIPGEPLGPTQLGFGIPHVQDIPPLPAAGLPDQALQVPGLFCTSWVDALPASCGHILRQPYHALSLLQQLELQEVAAPTQLVLTLLHVHNALQLVPPVAQRVEP